MTTARDIISLALKEAGILGVGQTALAEDINDGYTLLARMVKQWQVRRWLVPALTDIKAVGNANVSNTVGPGGYFDITPRPNEIKAGYVVQLNTGQTPISLPLRDLFSYENYARIAVKNMPSVPTHFFYDNAWKGGFGNLFVWPIPTNIGSSWEIHIIVERDLNFPITDTSVNPGPNTNLDTVFDLPDEYLEAIHYNLAVRMISMYQVTNPSPQTGILAKLALNTIKKANSQIPSMVMPGPLRGRKYGFNIYNPDGY